jgi:uncharacterized protein
MLKLAKGLDLPVDAVTQKFGILGRTGSGKSYAATKLAEEMLLIGAQIIALDVVGNWYGLRVPKSTRGKAFDILVFGGRNGDVEINPKAGKIVANVILEKNLSAVIDISEFISSEQTRFTYDFLTAFFEARKARPAACHIFLEEAQELVPQSLPPSQRGGDNFAARMLHAGERLLKIGRNYGIGATIITQRPQDVNKKVLNQSEVLMAFQMTGLQERKAIGEWVREKGQDENMAEYLPKLETGKALVWSPAWLKVSGIYKINEKLTADVSATPEVGVEPVAAKKLAPVDVEALKASIAELTEELEANTPAALKKKIAELQKQLSAKPTAAAGAPPEIRIKEVPVLKDSQLSIMKSLVVRLDGQISKFEGTVVALREIRNTIDQAAGAVVAAQAHPIAKAQVVATAPRPQRGPSINVPATSRTMPLNGHYRDAIGSKQQKMLDTLLTFEKLGRDSVERAIVGAFVGMSAKSGSFNTYVSGLKNGREGIFPPLIEYVAGSRLALTEAGRSAATTSIEISSVEDLHNAWKDQIKTAKQREIVDLVIANHPNPVTRELIGETIGMSSTSGSFNTYVSGLKSLGIIRYVQTSEGSALAATDLLFPEGLAY